jgi:hypothetical protein
LRQDRTSSCIWEVEADGKHSDLIKNSPLYRHWNTPLQRISPRNGMTLSSDHRVPGERSLAGRRAGDAPAASAHRHQLRKGSDVPYIAHPRRRVLSECVGFQREHPPAALLHDVVEDTECTLDEIARQFPANVVELVQALTEVKKDGSDKKRPWEDRKRDHLEQLEKSPFGARAIALADKLHNLLSMIFDLEHDGPGVWGRFNALPDRLMWYYRAMLKACDQGEPELRPLVDACNEALAKLEAAIADE